MSVQVIRLFKSGNKEVSQFLEARFSLGVLQQVRLHCPRACKRARADRTTGG
jgi:hypothetical protein